MRKFDLAVVVLALGCSSASDKGSAAVDPASEDFCLKWANAVCRMAYQCVDAGAQDAAFHSRYGATKDACWQSLEPRCTSNQSGGQAFGPSCGPGKKVNDTLADVCTDALDIESCVSWNVAPAGPCSAVCDAAGTVGGAGGPGSGNAGSGNAGSGNAGTGGIGGSSTSTGAVTTSRQFCDLEQSLLCDRIFECQPEAAGLLGTLASCKSAAAADCATSGEFCPGGYDATKGAQCVTLVKTSTCDQLMSEPEACVAACK
jgi:hypothetical protein